MDSVCNLGVHFTTDCSWNPRLTRTSHGLGLQLGLDALPRGMGAAVVDCQRKRWQRASHRLGSLSAVGHQRGSLLHQWASEAAGSTCREIDRDAVPAPGTVAPVPVHAYGRLRRRRQENPTVDWHCAASLSSHRQAHVPRRWCWDLVLASWCPSKYEDKFFLLTPYYFLYVIDACHHYF